MQKELILLGVLVSLLFSELTGISPGGIIVPGFLCFYLTSPQRLIWTLALSLLSAGLGVIARKYLFVYGRRQFVLMVLVAFTLDAAFSALMPLQWQSGVVGTLIPGIIANTCLKQGVFKTMLALAAAMALVVLAALALMGVSFI